MTDWEMISKEELERLRLTHLRGRGAEASDFRAQLESMPVGSRLEATDLTQFQINNLLGNLGTRYGRGIWIRRTINGKIWIYKLQEHKPHE